MKVFIAAIPRLAERHRYVIAHVARISRLPSEVIGVDGTRLNRDDPGGDGRHEKAYPSPQIGCALSHVAACRRIVEEGLPWAVVVEDDIVLPPDFDAIVAEIGGKLRLGEVISLYNPVMVKTAFSRNEALTGRRGLDLLVPFDMADVRTAAAYVIERAAAAGIAAGNMPVRYLADDFRGFHDEGMINHVRILHPTPCSVRPFPSSLEHFRARTLKRRITDAANRIPLVSSLVAVRRWLLRQIHSRNIIVSDAPSPLLAANPRFPAGGHPHG